VELAPNVNRPSTTNGIALFEYLILQQQQKMNIYSNLNLPLLFSNLYPVLHLYLTNDSFVKH